MYWCFVLHHHLQKVFRLICIALGNARPWTCLIFLPKHFCSSVKKNEHRKMTNLNHSHFYLRKLTRFWRYLGDDNVLYPFWNSFENVSVLEDGNYYTWTCHFGRNLCKVKRRQICWGSPLKWTIWIISEINELVMVFHLGGTIFTRFGLLMN